MSSSYGAYPSDTQIYKSKTFTANLSQNAATYDLCTASGGSVDIVGIDFYNSTAAAGLVSVTFQTNDTSVTTVLATVVLATLTGGKNLTNLTSSFVLPSTKKIQYTIVGTGSAGAITATVRYFSTAAGADIA